MPKYDRRVFSVIVCCKTFKAIRLTSARERRSSSSEIQKKNHLHDDDYYYYYFNCTGKRKMTKTTWYNTQSHTAVATEKRTKLLCNTYIKRKMRKYTLLRGPTISFKSQLLCNTWKLYGKQRFAFIVTVHFYSYTSVEITHRNRVDVFTKRPVLYTRRTVYTRPF